VFLEGFHVQMWTRRRVMNRSGVSVECRILAGVGTAGLCQAAIASKFTENKRRAICALNPWTVDFVAKKHQAGHA